MARKRFTTRKVTRDPVLMVIGEDDALEEVCQAMGRSLGSMVTVSPLDAAATRAARWRPFALVLPEHVYAFDPGEFDGLGRAVGAAVVPVTIDGLDRTALLEKLKLALDAAMTME